MTNKSISARQLVKMFREEVFSDHEGTGSIFSLDKAENSQIKPLWRIIIEIVARESAVVHLLIL